MGGTVFLGSKRQGLMAAQALSEAEGDGLRRLVTLDDSADPRCELAAFRAFAAGAGIDLAVAQSPQHARELLLEERPDRCFVSGWYWLIDAATLAAVPGGFVGLHNSLLPRYRGGAPIVWAMMAGETEVGASVFYLGEGMDDGDVLAQLPVTVGPDDHVAAVLARIEGRVREELPQIWREVVGGERVGQAQDAREATYCGQRFPGDGAIDWSWPARRIHDFVRAQSPPYPGAFTTDDGRPITILRTSPFDRPYHSTPGQVLLRTPEGTLVGCGDATALRVEVVAVEGAERPAGEVLRSVRMRLGA